MSPRTLNPVSKKYLISCLHQHYLHLIARSGAAASSQADNLAVQIADGFLVAIEVDRDGTAIERISEIDGGSC